MSRTSSQPFTEQEFELAQIFISFASLAIENARLFEQTKLTEQRQRLLIEQVPCLLWTTDRDLRFTSSVGITPRELQLPPGSVIGMSIYELFETDDPQMLPITAHRRALAGEPSAYDLAWHGRVFQTHVQPFRDAQGQVTGCIGVALDITERRHVEEALRESQALLQGIVDHAPMSIVIQDIADGRYLLVNRSLEAVTGLTVEQLIGKTIAELYPPEAIALWRAQDRSIAITRQSIQVEDDVLHRDGTLHTSLGIKFPLYDAKGDVFAIGGIFTDITERKRAEQEREQLIDALQEALANIKTLSGLLPICASCKNIRDDSGYWSQIEAYVQAHSDAVFSHGICPDCARRLYGDIFDD
jgi:PAS domain S-box-containing protein